MLFRVSLLICALGFFCSPSVLAQRSSHLMEDVLRNADVSVRSGQSLLDVRAGSNERYGFHAAFEVRVSPGIFKTLQVRQYFGTQQAAHQGMSDLKTDLPANSHLVYLLWITPTGSQGQIGE